jgi:hypothetical protein
MNEAIEPPAVVTDYRGLVAALRQRIVDLGLVWIQLMRLPAYLPATQPVSRAGSPRRLPAAIRARGGACSATGRPVRRSDRPEAPAPQARARRHVVRRSCDFMLLGHAVDGLAVVAFARRRKGVFPGTAMNTATASWLPAMNWRQFIAVRKSELEACTVARNAKANAVAQLLPHLCRSARATTGGQASGDASVATTLKPSNRGRS